MKLTSQEQLVISAANEFVTRLKEGEFSSELYYKFIGETCLINKSTLSVESRCCLSNRLWESAWFISRLLAYDLDPNDICKITNLSIDQKRVLADNIYFLVNNFTYKKSMRIDDFIID